MEQPRRRQRALGTMLPVLQNIAQMDEIGLLPYQPNPLATLLSGVARALMPLAMVRQARALEEERQRQQRLAELGTIISQYPPGQVPPEVWREYTQLAGVEAPPPPEPPEAALRREALQLEIERTRRLMPYEEQQMQLGIQQIQQQLQRGEIDMETARERLRQMREEFEFTRRLNEIQLERLQFENRPLREVVPDIEQRLPERLRGIGNIPVWQLQLLNQSGVLGMLADEFSLPASQFLTEQQKRWLQERGVNPDQISFGTALKVFPDLFRATRTVRETFGDRWSSLVQQYPFLEAIGDLPATPEVVFSLYDVHIKDEQLRRSTARQLYDDVLRRISEAQSKGAPPQLVGAWIATHNQLARELGLPEISPQEAQQIISAAATLYNINVKKEVFSLAKIQTDIQKGLVSMQTMQANAAANQARARAYIANVVSQIQAREAAAGRAEQQRALQLSQEVERRLQNIIKQRIPVTIRWQGQPVTVQFTPMGWQIRTPDGSVLPVRPEMQDFVTQQVRLNLQTQLLSEIAPPSQQIQRPQRSSSQSPQTPAQRIQQRGAGQTQQRRQTVVGVTRE